MIDFSTDDRPALPCSDKLPYSTPELAQAAAILAAYQYGTKLKTYRCRYCDRWHLSSA